MPFRPDKRKRLLLFSKGYHQESLLKTPGDFWSLTKTAMGLKAPLTRVEDLINSPHKGRPADGQSCRGRKANANGDVANPTPTAASCFGFPRCSGAAATLFPPKPAPHERRREPGRLAQTQHPLATSLLASFAPSKIHRRERAESPCENLAMAVETEITLSNQAPGKECEYRIPAVNKAGEGEPSNTIMAVL